MPSRGAVASVAAVAVLAVGAGGWWAATRGEPSAQATATPVATTASAPDPSVSPSPSPEPEPVLAWGPTVAQWEEALVDARELSLRQAAGQVIVAAVSSPDPAATQSLVDDLGLGGIIVMGDAVTDAEGVSALTAAAQRGGGERDWGTLVGVDQEGGTVARLRGVVPDLPSFMAAGAARDGAAVTGAYAQAGVDLHQLGFTADFAPVADVTIGLPDPTIRTRSAGEDAERVAGAVTSAVQGYLQGGVTPVIKHFPGHGSVTADSHDTLPRQHASLDELAARDLLPFASAIEAGVPAVMVGHIAVDAWGPGAATVEPAAYAYLRDELGFEGVIFTDAMNMAAVQGGGEPGQASVAALAAGADVVLLPPSPAAARDAIVGAVESGELSRDRLDAAAARVILLQRWQRSLEPTADAGDGYATALAIAGATVAAEHCGGPYVGDAVRLSGGFDDDRAALREELERRGVAMGTTGTSVLLLGADDGSGTADVVVAMGGPWGLATSTADVYVGLYGRSADALAGLADVLTGAAAPGGAWPVAVDVPYGTCGA